MRMLTCAKATQMDIAILAEMNVYKRLYGRFLQMLMEPMQGGKADG